MKQIISVIIMSIGLSLFGPEVEAALGARSCLTAFEADQKPKESGHAAILLDSAMRIRTRLIGKDSDAWTKQMLQVIDATIERHSRRLHSKTGSASDQARILEALRLISEIDVNQPEAGLARLDLLIRDRWDIHQYLKCR